MKILQKIVIQLFISPSSFLIWIHMGQFSLMCQEDPLEKGMATHSSILAWEISWTKLGRLQPMGPQIVGHDWTMNTFSITHVVLNFHLNIRCSPPPPILRQNAA